MSTDEFSLKPLVFISPEVRQDDEIVKYLRHRMGTRRKVSKGSLKTYSNALFVCRYRLGKPLSGATIDELDTLISDMQERKLKGRGGYSDATANLFKVVLRDFYFYVGKRDLAEQIETDKVKEKPLENVPTDEKVGEILGLCGVLEVRTLVLTIYSTGGRISELIGDPKLDRPPALIENFDTEMKMLKIVGKGGRQEDLPLVLRTEQAVTELKNFIGGRRSGPIFSIKYWKAYKAFKQVGKLAGVPNFTPHKLRHAFGTCLGKAGTELQRRQILLRHARPDTSTRYSHIELKDAMHEVERLKEAGKIC